MSTSAKPGTPDKTSTSRHYTYVGPPEILAAVRGAEPGAIVRAKSDLAALADAGMLTFIVSLEGQLRIADRRSEHVACAGAQPVLAAGELAAELPAAWNFAPAPHMGSSTLP